MRRADRLFQIIQILRGARGPVTADAMARELETSKRTVYRDVADLIGQRVPIQGEAGIGYVLDRDFDMPPLMLTPDEIEAAVLGSQWVMGRGDPALARAARDLIAKISASVPEHLRPFVEEPSLTTPPRWTQTFADAIDMAQVRASIRARGKIRLTYRDQGESETVRVIWPVAIGYREAVRILAAWCELRQDFRHFRTDRVTAAEFLAEQHPERYPALRAAWRKSIQRHFERVANGERIPPG